MVESGEEHSVENTQSDNHQQSGDQRESLNCWALVEIKWPFLEQSFNEFPAKTKLHLSARQNSNFEMVTVEFHSSWMTVDDGRSSGRFVGTSGWFFWAKNRSSDRFWDQSFRMGSKNNLNRRSHQQCWFNTIDFGVLLFSRLFNLKKF